MAIRYFGTTDKIEKVPFVYNFDTPERNDVDCYLPLENIPFGSEGRLQVDVIPSYNRQCNVVIFQGNLRDTDAWPVDYLEDWWGSICARCYFEHASLIAYDGATMVDMNTKQSQENAERYIRKCLNK